MLIYEKNNKLNINFENNIEEQPDIVLGKEDGRTEILVDGNSNPSIPTPEVGDEGKFLGVNASGEYALANAGGSSTSGLVTASGAVQEGCTIDKTYVEIIAMLSTTLPYMVIDGKIYVLGDVIYDDVAQKYVVLFISQVDGAMVRFASSTDTGIMTYSIK